MQNSQNSDQQTRSYLICATPRSGSTLLCEALRNTGLAGNPDEYFGPMHVERWNEAWKTGSKREYLKKVSVHGSGKNGVLGIKVMRVYWRNVIEFLQEAQKSIEHSESTLLSQCFPNLKYIWITRRDKVRQAISWMKFIQGAAWYWESEIPQEIDGLEFRPEVIKDFILSTTIQETAWQEFFRKAKIEPYIVVYEDLVDQYVETAKGILDYLRIPYTQNLDFGQRRLERQADSLTDAWVKQVLEMFPDTEKI